VADLRRCLPTTGYCVRVFIFVHAEFVRIKLMMMMITAGDV